MRSAMRDAARDVRDAARDVRDASPPRKRNTTEEGNYICAVCGCRKRDQYNLDKHLRAHESGRALSQECSDEEEYDDEEESSSYEEVYRAPIRPRPTTPHTIPTKRPSVKRAAPSAPSTQFACKRCNETFFKQFNLDRHNERFHAVQPEYKCGICKKPFAKKYNLKRHKAEVHGR